MCSFRCFGNLMNRLIMTDRFFSSSFFLSIVFLFLHCFPFPHSFLFPFFPFSRCFPFLHRDQLLNQLFSSSFFSSIVFLFPIVFSGKAAVSCFLFRWSAHQSSFTKERLQKIEMNNKIQNRANNLPKQE